MGDHIRYTSKVALLVVNANEFCSHESAGGALAARKLHDSAHQSGSEQAKLAGGHATGAGVVLSLLRLTKIIIIIL